MEQSIFELRKCDSSRLSSEEKMPQISCAQCDTGAHAKKQSRSTPKIARKETAISVFVVLRKASNYALQSSSETEIARERPGCVQSTKI